MEADETYVLESRKGARGLERKARRRGGKAKKRGLSREQVPVLMAADRSRTTVSAVLPRVDAAALTAALDPVVAKDALLVSDGGASYPPCAAALGVSHEALNRTMGERVRGDLHVQTVNSRHSRLKDFLRPRRGIATRYLDNYLSWFHLVGLAPGANDRACLAAAVTELSLINCGSNAAELTPGANQPEDDSRDHRRQTDGDREPNTFPKHPAITLKIKHRLGHVLPGQREGTRCLFLVLPKKKDQSP